MILFVNPVTQFCNQPDLNGKPFFTFLNLFANFCHFVIRKSLICYNVTILLTIIFVMIYAYMH